MTTDKIRIAVAECLGGKKVEVFEWTDALPSRHIEKRWIDINDLPNYLASLDACAEFEKTLQGEVFEQYYVALFNVLNWDNKFWGKQRDLEMIRATALQRCEAYLRVKGKWPY